MSFYQFSREIIGGNDMVDSQTVSLYKKLMWAFGIAGLVF